MGKHGDFPLSSRSVECVKCLWESVSMSTRRIISREKTTHLPQISRGELLFTPTLVSELSGILPLIGVNRIDIRFSEKKIERTGQHFTIVKKRVEPISNDRQVLVWENSMSWQFSLMTTIVILFFIDSFIFVYLLLREDLFSVLYCFCFIFSYLNSLQYMEGFHWLVF